MSSSYAVRAVTAHTAAMSVTPEQAFYERYFMKFDSISERVADPIIAAAGGTRCDTFAPLLSQTYDDAAGAPLHGKPDFLIHRGGGFHFVDTKSGVLNNCYTQEESTAALREAYAAVFGRGGNHLHQSALSSALYGQGTRGQILARDAAWNHSAFKHLAIQAKHGFQRYFVVFDKNPTGRDAARYCALGLVWCTLKTLPDLLQTIELMRHGIYIPFVFTSRNYSFTVTPDPSSKGLSSFDVEFIDRGRFLATVAANQAAAAAEQAADDAAFAAGLSPY